MNVFSAQNRCNDNQNKCLNFPFFLTSVRCVFKYSTQLKCHKPRPLNQFICTLIGSTSCESCCDFTVLPSACGRMRVEESGEASPPRLTLHKALFTHADFERASTAESCLEKTFNLRRASHSLFCVVTLGWCLSSLRGRSSSVFPTRQSTKVTLLMLLLTK